jgi:hypothetical protein
MTAGADNKRVTFHAAVEQNGDLHTQWIWKRVSMIWGRAYLFLFGQIFKISLQLSAFRLHSDINPPMHRSIHTADKHLQFT